MMKLIFQQPFKYEKILKYPPMSNSPLFSYYQTMIR